MKENKQIQHNINVHDKVYKEYDGKHGEIFNKEEQRRLRSSLEKSVGEIKTKTEPKRAFDFGCGSGNLTRHLLSLNLEVTASDISRNFLKLIKENYKSLGKINTLKLNGKDLSNVEDNHYDLVATYSVLHHIPDYLQAVSEMARITKQGGIIYIDHEQNDNYWNQSGGYKEFIEIASPEIKKTWKRFLKVSTYIIKFKEVINPKYQVEGDIHVWPDDHIEWNKIEEILLEQNFEVIFKKDYLLYKAGYPLDFYNKYKDKYSDMRVFIARKK